MQPQNHNVRIYDTWRPAISVADDKIHIWSLKTPKNETEAESIRDQVQKAGGTCGKITYISERLENVENRSEAETYSQMLNIENDNTIILIQLCGNL